MHYVCFVQNYVEDDLLHFSLESALILYFARKYICKFKKKSIDVHLH